MISYFLQIRLLKPNPYTALEQAARGIGLFVNIDKTMFMRFKQNRAISTLSSKLLKIFDQFTYLDNNISSTESEHGHKKIMHYYWQAVDCVKISSSLWLDKTGYFSSCSYVGNTLWLHQLDFNETLREKVRWEQHGNVTCCF